MNIDDFDPSAIGDIFATGNDNSIVQPVPGGGGSHGDGHDDVTSGGHGDGHDDITTG